MAYNLNIHTNAKHRIYVTALIKYIHPAKELNEVRVMVDTGCYNTMVPLWMAKRTGYNLGINRSVVIGGTTGTGQLYALNMLHFGGCVIERAVVLAYPFPAANELYDTILLGTNIFNNWRYTIDRETGTFTFTENLPHFLPNKINPY